MELFKNFFKTMKNSFGKKFTTLFYEIKGHIKLVAYLEYKIFYFKFLKSNNILPITCRINNNYLKAVYPDMIYNFEWKTFQKISFTKYRNLINVKNRLYFLKNLFISNFCEMDTVATFFHLNNYKKYMDGKYAKIFKKNRMFLNRKYNLKSQKWIKNLTQPLEVTNEIIDTIQTKGFVNLSNCQLTSEQISLLNNGPKFTLKSGKHKYEDILIKTDLEIICRELLLENNMEINPEKLKEQQKLTIKSFTSNVLTKVSNNTHRNQHLQGSDPLLEQIKSLILTNELLIILADKSSTLVLIEKSMYITKMEEALNKNNFQLINYNNTEKNERILQGLLRECLKRKILDEYKYKQIYPSSSPPVTIYGKIKLHKANLDVRPIVNTRNSYVAKTSKWLVDNLKKYNNRKYSLKNSFQLKNEFKFLKLKPNYYIISLDVESMFGSIDLQATLDYILTKFKFDPSKPFNHMTLDLLSSLLEVCTKDVCCMFNGKTYIQTYGCGMGLNLSPLLCEIQMWIVENKIMNTRGVGIGKGAYIVAYRRYVDDLIFVLSDQKYCDDLLNLANSILPNISFTMEKEKNCKINFLDLTLIRRPTYIDFTVYRKVTQNTLRIDYFSLFDKHIIINNLSQEIIRAYKICSNEKLLMLELIEIRRIYMTNNYPDHVINKHIRIINSRFTGFQYLQTENLPNVKTKRFIKIESNSVEVIQKHFKILQKSNVWTNSNNIVLVHVGPKTLGNILKNINGEILDFSLKKCVVYFFQCGCGATYVGNTLRTIKVRALEHSKQDISSINEHSKITGHQFDIDNFKILSINENTLRRFIMEKFFIERLKSSLNKEKGVFILFQSL